MRSRKIQRRGESGVGNSYTTEFRMLDPRLGRWWSIDPVTHDDVTPYIVMSNNPIARIDPAGDDDYYSENGDYLYTDSKSTTDIRIVKFSDYLNADNQRQSTISGASHSSFWATTAAVIAANQHFESTIQTASHTVIFDIMQGNYLLGHDNAWYDMWQLSNRFIGGDGNERSAYLILDVTNLNNPRVYLHLNNDAGNHRLSHIMIDSKINMAEEIALIERRSPYYGTNSYTPAVGFCNLAYDVQSTRWDFR